jgi:hypothetical protein
VSYDFHVVIDTGGAYKHTVESNLSHTSNARELFAEALQLRDDEHTLLSIEELDGRVCSEAQPIVQAALARIAADERKYRALAPKDWGSFASAVALLTQLEEWCVAHPLASLRVT